MAADDVIVGIDGSGAKRGADEVVSQLDRITKASGNMSKRAGARIDSLYTKIQKLAGVTGVSAAKISSINNLATAISSLGSARGPSKSTVQNVSALFKALAGMRAPAGMGSFTNAMATLSGFKGPSKTSVSNLRSLFNALAKLPGTAGLQKMLGDLRLITARLAPVAAALTRLQGAGGAAANGLRRAGQAARSTHADFVGLRASSLSLGGALLRTGEFASALGAAFGLRAIATEINTLQKTESGLMAVTGSMAQARKEMEFLMATARTYKVYVGDLSLGYSQFRIASEGLGLTLTQTQQIFKDVTQGVRVFNLSTDDAEGVFRALTQIASKGSLQMEELRGQLGDRMPVAVQAMANALKVTTSELADMMKKGQVTGDVLKRGLIGFGAEIRRMTNAGLVTSVNTLGASLGDLKTTFYEFANAAGTSGLNEFFRNVAAGLQSVMTAGSPANTIMQTMAGTLAFVSRNVSILIIALAALAIPKVVTFFTEMAAKASVAALAMAANTAATTANTASQTGLVGKLGILGAARSTTTGLTNLHTAATAGNTVATFAAIRAQGLLSTAIFVVRGALRALWLAMLANPLTALLIAVTALASGFIWLKDKFDTARVSQEAFQRSTDAAADSSMAALSSLQALVTEYINIANAATTASLAQDRLNSVTRGNAAFKEADEAKGRIERVRANTRARGGTLAPVDFNNKDSVEAAINRAVEAASTARGREAVSLKSYTQDLVTYAQSMDTANKNVLRVVAADKSRELQSRGITGEAFALQLSQHLQGAAAHLGVTMPALEPKKDGIITATDDKDKNKPGKKSDAEREMERRIETAKRFVSAMDPVYEANDRYAESMKALSDVSASAFGTDTVERIELMRRAVNEAFGNIGKFDVVGNLNAEWEDNKRMVDAYGDALRKSGIFTQELVDRAGALSRLEYAANYTDALGPIGKMADLISNTERKMEQMKAASANLALSESTRAMLASEIADEYGRAAREIARSSRQGQLLNAQFENALDTAGQIGDVLADSFGSASADNLMLTIERMRREAEGIRSSLPDLSAATGRPGSSVVAAGPVVDIGNNTFDVGELVVTATRNARTAIFQSGQEVGTVMKDGVEEGFNALDLKRIADAKMLRVFSTISDAVSQGGLIGKMQEYGEAIDSVRASMARMDAASPMFARQRQLLDQMTQAAENMRASYYESALEATKMGSVVNNSLDSAADALTDFVRNGTLDVGSFLREIQADLIKTFAITPLLNKAKEAIAGAMGIQDPGNAKSAEGLALTSANITKTAADNLLIAAQATQQTQALEQSFLNALQVRQEASMTQLGTHVASFGAAVAMMPNAANAMSGGMTTGPQVLSPFAPQAPLTPIGTAVPGAAGGQGGAVVGQVTGAVNNALAQPSQLLTQGAQTLVNGAGQMASSALGLTGVAGQFAGMIIPQMLSAVISQLFSATATSGAAVATTTAAAATGTAATVGLGGAAVALMAAAAALTTAAIVQQTMSMIPGFHSGGIAGGSPTFSRPMSAGAFAGAPKYHVGGIAGFKPGEMPAILKRGEEILTEDNPRHIGNYFAERGIGASGGEASVSSTSISQSNEITIVIQGGGGTPQQNDDLAQKIAKELPKMLNSSTRSTMDKRARGSDMKVK